MTRLRDWWRGWSDADLESAIEKVAQHIHLPGAAVKMTISEMRAYMEWDREQHPRWPPLVITTSD